MISNKISIGINKNSVFKTLLYRCGRLALVRLKKALQRLYGANKRGFYNE